MTSIEAGLPAFDTLSRFSLEDKVVVVTGSGYGIGRQIALGIAGAGAKVVVCGRSEDKVADTAETILSHGGVAIAVAFDATEKQDCVELVNCCVEQFGRIDAMVINHGVIEVNAPEDLTEEQWLNVVHVNLNSCFYCAQAAGSQMIDQGEGGALVMVSSNGSLTAFAGLAAYGASKGGVDQLCRQLAAEWGKYRIRVNTINPGYTDNQMGGRPKKSLAPDLEVDIENLTPLERRGRAEEMVGPVLFLASDAASFVTGHCLVVDGGYSIL